MPARLSNPVAAHATGAIDNKPWTNNSGDVGFDNIELAYATPVSATEVRLTFANNLDHVLKEVEAVQLVGQ